MLSSWGCEHHASIVGVVKESKDSKQEQVNSKGESMKFKTRPQKPVIVNASQAMFPGFLSDGTTEFNEGNWIVTYSDGTTEVLDADDFHSKFSVIRKRGKPAGDK